ncbi:MAG: chromosomal replication initiator protein DnaA, partial [bacterium]
MTQDLLQLWKAVLGEMEVTISSPEFRTWFSNSQIIEQKENTFTIGVSNNFAKERMRKKYEKQIVKILEKITKTKDILLDFQISHKGGITQTSAPSSRPKTPTNAPSRKGKPTETATLSLDIAQTNRNPRYTFESFIVGNGNRLAHAACKAVSENPGNAYNPLFLYSGVGLGKTHLTQSIGMAVLKRFPGKKVFYVTTEQFTNELVGSIRNQSSQDFRKKYRKNDVLLIDDIQFIAGKERTQEEFFHTFNALREANRQVVLTSDRPPKEILTLEERLRSRFESGLIVDIAPPDYETRLAILRFKTESAQLDIPGDVLEFIARSITNNIRELEGALNSILAKSQLEEIPITLSSAQEVLGKTLG